MKLEAFRKLRAKRQQQLVLDQGVPLGQRTSKNFSIYLYAVDSFYVEIYFYRSCGEYATLRSFDEMERLEPYLAGINISEVMV